MALFFDVTDLFDWQGRHLTGIPRVVIHVFRELRRIDPAVTLVRFDTANRAFVELAPGQLPETLRRYGGFPAQWEAAPQPRLLGGPRPRRSLRDWILRRGAPLQPQPLGEPQPRPGAPPFGSGDVCLSLGLVWFKTGYWDAVEAAKLRQTRWVQLIHDIGFITHPQWVRPEWTTEGTAWMHNVARHADVLLATSRFQAGEIERFLLGAKLPTPPIRIVRLGDDPPGLTAPDGQTPTAAVTRRPFVLCVSGFHARKNHHALYQVWRRLADERGERCPDLVLAGELPTIGLDLLGQIRTDPLTRGRVHILHDAGDELLAELYRTCLFTVFPSHYEGWGLPVAESLRLGRYCIASSAASVPEIGGDLVDHVDPIDQRGWKDAIVRALDDPGYVAERESAIRLRYRPWSWRDTATQISQQVDALAAASPAVSPNAARTTASGA